MFYCSIVYRNRKNMSKLDGLVWNADFGQFFRNNTTPKLKNLKIQKITFFLFLYAMEQ